MHFLFHIPYDLAYFCYHKPKSLKSFCGSDVRILPPLIGRSLCLLIIEFHPGPLRQERGSMTAHFCCGQDLKCGTVLTNVCLSLRDVGRMALIMSVNALDKHEKLVMRSFVVEPVFITPWQIHLLSIQIQESTPATDIIQMSIIFVTLHTVFWLSGIIFYRLFFCWF